MKRLIWAFPLLLMACSSSEDAATTSNATSIKNPFRGVMQDRSVATPAAALFVEKCSMCHRQMGMGTVLLARRMKPEVAMLEQRTDLTPELIKVAVRQGIGNMPRISKGEVSDQQLEEIAAYLSKSKKQ